MIKCFTAAFGGKVHVRVERNFLPKIVRIALATVRRDHDNIVILPTKTIEKSKSTNNVKFGTQIKLNGIEITNENNENDNENDLNKNSSVLKNRHAPQKM